MAASSLSRTDCAIAKTLGVVGERWTLMVLRNAFHGMRTFDAFQKHLGLSTSVLSARLKTLTDAGVLERRPSSGDGRSFEYRLTECGLDLYPILVGLMDWGEKWAPSERGERLRLVERSTGNRVQGACVLSADGRPLRPQEVRPEPGSGADAKTLELLGGATGRRHHDAS